MTPHRALPPYDWAALLSLIRTEFAYMAGRIDPPSSMHRLTEADIAAKATSGEVWVIGTPPVACVFLTIQDDSLYIGKLAVAAAHRGQGHARSLIAQAKQSACALGLSALTLETRVELTENHAVFRNLGFVETARTAHPGYNRPTSISFFQGIDLP